MIPSRPLSLVDIIGETLSISFRIFPRYALLLLILILPGISLFTYGTSELSSQALVRARSDLALNDSDVTSLRNDFRVWMAKQNPMIEQEERIFGVPDTILAPGRVSLHQVREYFESNLSQFSNAWVLLGAGGLLLLLGAFGLLSSTIDLACQYFEERGQNVAEALRSSIARHLWILLGLYLVYFVAGLLVDVLFGLTAVLPNSVQAFFGSMITVIEIYIGIRLFATVPAVISEEIGPIPALRRSWRLTLGHGIRILGTSVGFGVILFLAAIVVSVIAGFAFGDVIEWCKEFLTAQVVTVPWILRSLPGFLWQLAGEITVFILLLGAFFPVFVTVFYYDLRTRRDGALVYLD
ncbi:MAG: hypothetical protein Q8922_06460 [Bacteroidota bacterium]|nr:hypothetical protein [Bacteroidota bacterium]MDP4233801.1 hypothetical protein [Bacteroidota bacterium]MDP4242440.1 hypothetical protein [Bacteroidota bacterium]MDP4287562.1 hypothetical protein [Bacteroidota bacterium]